MARVRNPQVTRSGARPAPRREATSDATAQAGARGAISPQRPSPTGPIWRRDLGFALGVLMLCVVTVLAFSAGGAALHRSQTTPTPAAPATVTAPPASTATSGQQTARAVKAKERVYPMPETRVGLMQPAVDKQGNVWVGEMGTNRLARLDRRTGVVTTWQPPNGQYNIMATAIDAQGRVWFTEQVANYMGRFDPATQQFTTYPLEKVNGHSSSPQDLAFDAAGNLWFTEITSAKIGRLNPLTGAISTWPVPPARSGAPSYPFSLAITPTGQVWFGQLDGGVVGRLNPATGEVRQFLLADPHAQVYAMAADARGRVWFTELLQGKLGMVETATGKVTEIRVPEAFGGSANLYGIVAGRDGSVWFACTASNAIVRYEPGKGTFTFYQLATKDAIPFGLTQDATGTLWLTGTGSVRDYVGALRP